MTPFVGSGSIHEAMSVWGEFSTISSVKFLGAEGTGTREDEEKSIKNPKADFWGPHPLTYQLSKILVGVNGRREGGGGGGLEPSPSFA